MHPKNERLWNCISHIVCVLKSDLRLAGSNQYSPVNLYATFSPHPMPPSPTRAARAPGFASLSRIQVRISGRSMKSGSGAKGTVENGSHLGFNTGHD